MNNIFDTIARLQQFRNQLQGQNPQALLDQLIASGKVSQDQVDEARKKAEALADALNIKI